nr:MAG TPA: hypothetical protein [Caudoviricetes sp.]
MADKLLTVAAWVLSFAVLYGIVKLVQAFPRLMILLGF